MFVRAGSAFFAALPLLSILPACSGDAPEFAGLWESSTSRVVTPTVQTEGADGKTVTHQRPWLMDADGRYVQVYGVNVSGSNKFPPTEEFPSLYPLPDDATLRARCESEFPMPAGCVPADPAARRVDYVGKPFPLDEADRWFGQLAELGFGAVRLITSWEAVQPYRPGTCEQGSGRYDADCHDLAYLDYYEAIIAKAAEHGIYVLVDMHQDVFTRHVYGYFNEHPDAEPGSMEATLLSLFPPYTDWVRGDGAPRWIVETCLPEKDLDAPYFGMFRALGALKDESGATRFDTILALADLVGALLPDTGGGLDPDFLAALYAKIDAIDHFEPWETSDVLPFTFWGTTMATSLDMERCVADFFAGDTLYPNHEVTPDGVSYPRLVVGPGGEESVELAPDDPDGDLGLVSIKEYMQEAYIGSYLAVVERARGHDNVIGYDLMNEPPGLYVMLALGAAYVLETDGIPQAIAPLVEAIFGPELGPKATEVLKELNMLPTFPEGISDEDKDVLLYKWGLYGVDVGTALDVNLAFDGKYLEPFYSRLGQQVQALDPDAVIWIEPGASIRTLLGAGVQWDQPLTRPAGVDQLVFAPHWYPDIYPFIGFLQPPREFNADEWLYRDFEGPLADIAGHAEAFLGNAPTVFGEFGTYFNFGGIEASIADDFQISAQILDRYYEAFEDLNLGSMVWCFSPENSYDDGEGWNKEDFSIVDPAGEPRAWTAYVRPHVRAASGKLVHQHFYSQHSFLDPDKGIRNPDREYELRIESKETDAPTGVFVPERQYPEGFYAWLSDGVAYYDADRQMLYWYPTRDAPGVEHVLRLRPPLSDSDVHDWSYFFRKGEVLVGRGGAL